MANEKYIEVKDGLTIPEMRELIEVTNTMVRAINKEEYTAIMLIYGKSADRLLGGQNDR